MIKTAINKLEDSFDITKSFIGKRFFEPVNVIIQCYNGYGDEHSFRLRGRVLEAERHLENPDNAHDTTAIAKNFWYMLKRFESDEVPGVIVNIDINNRTYTTKTDKEGFFYFEINEKLDKGWNELLVYSDGKQYRLDVSKIESKGYVHIADPKADFMVISDIDDTIMKSYIPTPLKMLKELITNGARNRAAFEGTGEFFQALANCNDLPVRPLFFVSGSPWNIYDVLEEFIEYNDFPKAPLFLKDLGITDSYIFAPVTKNHKLRYISELMEFFNTTDVILIGDSGQEDAEIYTEAIRKYPSRIKTVYIRDVIEGQKSAQFEKLLLEINDMDSELVVFEKTNEAAKHALEKGYIDKSGKTKIEKIPEQVKKTTAV
jgi:phosphatidate phosphatase APP1